MPEFIEVGDINERAMRLCYVKGRCIESFEAR